MGGTRAGAATCGLLSVAAGMAASELPSALSTSFPGLVGPVGQRVIRSAPGDVVHLAIKSVGTADKPLLLGAIVAVLLLAGAAVGPLALRRPVAVDLLTTTVAVLGAAVAGATALVPAALAAAVAIGTRRTSLAVLSAGGRQARADADIALLAPLGPTDSRRPAAADLAPLGPTSSRRGFLAAGSIAAGSTVVALGSAAALRRTGGAAAPAALPASAEATGAAALGLAVPGLSPLVTPTSAFYRIDEALMVPAVDPAAWRLKVAGMVGAPFELSYADLLAEPLVERHITLCCVSNDVGGRLVGTARWTGVRLADLLRRAGVDPAATQLVGRSVDGFTVGFPVAAALDGREALVAVGMNGEPLLPKHGFPARLVVPGLYGFVSATKWLTELELTTWEAFDPYWVKRGWSRQAPVKIASRVDVPKDYTRVAPGRQAIAGVAWAPIAGIASVAFRVDGGSWQDARLGPSLGDDVWRQWTAEWDPPPGTHEIEVRAVAGDGLVQTDDRRSAFPNGASGYHRSHVRVVPLG